MTPRQKVRRASFMLVFGEGDKRWSFPDPCHPIVDAANRAARGYGQHWANPIVLAEVVSALVFLVYCPSTKLATAKFAAIRRAVRELPNDGDES